jgi:hypothetical protein
VTKEVDVNAEEAEEALQVEFDLLQTRYGLEEWRLVVNTRMTSYLGRCKTSRQEIHVAQWVIDKLGVAQAINTLRYEIAHALTPGNGHGIMWKIKCRELGIAPERNKTLPPELNQAPEWRWVGECTQCGYVLTGWLRKPRALWAHATATCRGILIIRRVKPGELDLLRG